MGGFQQCGVQTVLPADGEHHLLHRVTLSGLQQPRKRLAGEGFAARIHGKQAALRGKERADGLALARAAGLSREVARGIRDFLDRNVPTGLLQVMRD